MAQGEILPDDDQQADLYLWTVGRLERAGYPQYEISNFAKPGFASRHNLRYWLTQPYIGFGPGAHSDFGGRRYSFVQDLDAYIQGVLQGGDIIDESEIIPKRERCGEYLMLRLRTVQGINEPGVPQHLFHGLRSSPGPAGAIPRSGLGGADRRALAFHPKRLPAVQPAYRRPAGTAGAGALGGSGFQTPP